MAKPNTEKSTLWTLLADHKPKRKQFVVMTLLVLIATAFELVIPLYSSYLVDSISASGLDYWIIASLIALVLIAALSEGILGWYGARLGEGVNLSLRYSLIGRVLNAQQSTMNQQHSAELSARIANDSMSIKSILAEDLIGLLSGVISLISVIIVMSILDWRLTLVLVTCVLVGFVIITPLALSMQGIGLAVQNAEANLISQTTDWFRSSKLVRAHNGATDILKQGDVLLANSYKHAMRQAKVLAMIGPISNLVLMMSMVAILACSAYWIANGSLTLGTVTAFLMYLFGLAFPLMAMGMFFSRLQRAMGASVRLQEISQFPIEANTGNRTLEDIRSLRTDSLSFSIDEHTILNNVTVSFSHVGMTVLVGMSGSGKSTLIQQLLGFYQQTQDAIYVNDLPMSDYNLLSVRHHMAWLDQEPKLFCASIRDNLTLGLVEIPDDTTIIAALGQVGLGKWCDKLDNNLDTLLTEQLQQLSGGEKQRFALARALLRKPKVLIMDEPTSALDKDNEAKLMGLIREMAKDISIVMVTHNKALILPTDKVIELDSGRVTPAVK